MALPSHSTAGRPPTRTSADAASGSQKAADMANASARRRTGPGRLPFRPAQGDDSRGGEPEQQAPGRAPGETDASAPPPGFGTSFSFLLLFDRLGGRPSGGTTCDTRPCTAAGGLDLHRPAVQTFDRRDGGGTGANEGRWLRSLPAAGRFAVRERSCRPSHEDRGTGARQSLRRAGSATGTTRWCVPAASWWRGGG